MGKWNRFVSRRQINRWYQESGKASNLKNLMDAPHAVIKEKENLKTRNLVGNQNSPALHSVVMAWQRESVHIPTWDDGSNKKFLPAYMQSNPGA